MGLCTYYVTMFMHEICTVQHFDLFWFRFIEKKFPKNDTIYSESARGRLKYYRHLLKLQKTLITWCVKFLDVFSMIFKTPSLELLLKYFIKLFACEKFSWSLQEPHYRKYFSQQTSPHSSCLWCIIFKILSLIAKKSCCKPSLSLG